VNEERRFLVPSIRELGDASSKRNIDAHLRHAPTLDGDGILEGFATRLSLIRDWQLFLERFPIIVLPVSHQPPFRNGLDQESESVVTAMMDAQRSLLAIPVLGFPSVVVPTGSPGGLPVGVQVIAGRYREDLCFDAAEIIEARAPILTPIDPRD